MNAWDWLVIFGYGIAVLALGAFAGRGQRSGADLMLARRDLPVWAVLCSMVATELSAATFVGVPHDSYRHGSWFYLQIVLGMLLGKIVLAYTVIPLYHRLGVVTVYGYLATRFGPGARRAGALFFVLGRILASGVRLYIGALAFSVVTGIAIEPATVVCGVVAGIYTLWGGIRAVVWTDVLQGGLFVVAAVSAIAVLAIRLGTGPWGILERAAAEGELHVVDFSAIARLASDRPFVAAVIGGFFLVLATHGTDHDMVQRLLTTRTGRQGGRALIGSGLLGLPLTAVFLFIGTGLAIFYADPPAYDISDHARIFPIFVLHEMPAGLRGLIFAGLFAAAMSSLDSATCALSTTWVTDIRPRREASGVDSPHRVRRFSGIFIALLVVAALGVAVYDRAVQANGGAANFSLVKLALSAMTIVYGGMLGVFLLGLTTRRRGNDGSVIAGLVAGTVTGFALFLHPLWMDRTVVAWIWWIPVGAAVSAGIAALARTPDREPERE